MRFRRLSYRSRRALRKFGGLIAVVTGVFIVVTNIPVKVWLLLSGIGLIVFGWYVLRLND